MWSSVYLILPHIKARSAALYTHFFKILSNATYPLPELWAHAAPLPEKLPSSCLGLATATHSSIAAQVSVSGEAFADHTAYEMYLLYTLMASQASFVVYHGYNFMFVCIINTNKSKIYLIPKL